MEHTFAILPLAPIYLARNSKLWKIRTRFFQPLENRDTLTSNVWI